MRPLYVIWKAALWTSGLALQQMPIFSIHLFLELGKKRGCLFENQCHLYGAWKCRRVPILHAYTQLRQAGLPNRLMGAPLHMYKQGPTTHLDWGVLFSSVESNHSNNNTTTQEYHKCLIVVNSLFKIAAAPPPALQKCEREESFKIDYHLILQWNMAPISRHLRPMWPSLSPLEPSIAEPWPNWFYT